LCSPNGENDDKTVLSSTLRTVHGYTATPAKSGAEALRLIESELAIDLVIADFAMNGVELARALGKIRLALPVII
jgi:CheY-like chemotaxis protein